MQKTELFLDNLIHKEHTVFIKGRFLGGNIRLLYNIMHYTDSKQITGLWMLIGFEKAFGNVLEMFYLKLRLLIFNLCIQNWTKLFFNQIKSCVIQNENVDRVILKLLI